MRYIKEFIKQSKLIEYSSYVDEDGKPRKSYQTLTDTPFNDKIKEYIDKDKRSVIIACTYLPEVNMIQFHFNRGVSIRTIINILQQQINMLSTGVKNAGYLH